jgi:hypothetical protein
MGFTDFMKTLGHGLIDKAEDNLKQKFDNSPVGQTIDTIKQHRKKKGMVDDTTGIGDSSPYDEDYGNYNA